MCTNVFAETLGPKYKPGAIEYTHMEGTGIYARPIPDLDRSVQIGVASGRVISVSFPREADPGTKAEHELLDRIEAYLDGEPDSFEDVTVGLTVPTDLRSVLETLRSVPFGEMVTVARLANMTPGLDADDADDRDTVVRALSENPIPLILADHRVVDGPSAAPADVRDRLESVEGIAD